MLQCSMRQIHGTLDIATILSSFLKPVLPILKCSPHPHNVFNRASPL